MRSVDTSTWMRVESCPLCGSAENAPSKTLAVEEYRHGDERIPLPPEGIGVTHCYSCGLVFKDAVPFPRFLAEVFERQAGKVWAGDYGFHEEAELIERLVGSRDFDLLDIGPSNGGLLKAFSDSGGRRSALDVIKHPGLEQWLCGEFVRGLAEDRELVWGGEPYDVVGMFDIIEHLYDPEQAFSNLEAMVKSGGFVVIETGDVRSYWPQKFGVHRWWYACLFQHHTFWSLQCLEELADRHGFSIIDFARKRQKERVAFSLRRDTATAIRSIPYHFNPDLYRKLSRSLGKNGTQPWSPFAKDHFRAVLKRES